MSPDRQVRRRVVVDGSNIATEGRTVPSLAQLDEAIRSFLDEYQGFATTDVTVVVDATFGHRIDASEIAAFEQALDHGEMVTPPAGAVGRGDGFILRIAEKSGALVLSNDSFQEFHEERPWLFEPGRLIGGKPVEGVGWVFTPRTPVRGAKSRVSSGRSKRDGASEPGTDAKSAKAVKGAKAAEAGRATKSAKAAKSGKAAKAAAPATAKTAKTTQAAPAAKAAKAEKTRKPDKAPKAAKAAKAEKTRKPDKAPKAAKAAKPAKQTKPPKAEKQPKPQKTTKEPVRTKAAKPEKPEKAPSGKSGAAALNDPVVFLRFVADHPVGQRVQGTVASFTSHGAHVDVDGMLCHIPLNGLGDPPPTKARQVLSKGETRSFVLVSLDPARRRAALALPGLERA